ncbi:glucose-1-phosphate adenylyltransferase subunit GlgD [Desulfitibacter alkalitolerans]|uniref:glucose-1-phosphate adenylyltransferase subunit GlgD n=1 Tax=Desulfitibacter alkalitolerans TaxID=264641 RepID=UPI000485CE6C|nr:glucose-1-phosphate adenylyltransferase subunit GlgD [Desulfitibacter alkalitolerans]
MKNVMGILKLTESEKYLREITAHRGVSSIPFGSRYRLIDFILSNMVNSGISNVGVFTHEKSRSLVDHLRSGKWWDLHRLNNGLFILPTEAINQPRIPLRGDLEIFQAHIDYINNSPHDYVVIANSNMICNIDFRRVFDFYKEQDADVVLVYKKDGLYTDDFYHLTLLDINENQRVVDIEYCPLQPRFDNVFMDMAIMKKSLLLDIINTCCARGGADLLKDGLIKNIDKLKIFGFHHEGFLARITTMESYFKYSMELLEPGVWYELFNSSRPIYTKVKNSPSTEYHKTAMVKNSLIASGCLIQGVVENSIIFRGVDIHQNAVVRNSIVISKSKVEENAYIENVILDKDVTISRSKVLKGDLRHPIFIGKKFVI